MTSPKYDVDVHIRWAKNEALLNYLPRAWHSRWLLGHGHTQRGIRILPRFYDPDSDHQPPGIDTASMQAEPSPERLLAEWVEPNGFDGVIVSVYDAPILSTFGDIDYPLEVAAALNRWTTEQWLSRDRRLLGSISVATQDPEAAAREISRAAEHPQMVQIILPTGTQRPYGHRHYRPIWQAAHDCGLAVAIHGGTEGVGTSYDPTPCGWPGTVAEMTVARSLAMMGHLTSLVTEGTFIEFPELRIVGLETGAAWVPVYLWRFDKNYKGLRAEAPWLKELPSEYVRRYFRFGTQGVEPADPPSELWRLMASVKGEEMLLFSSNYPRWNYEAPGGSFALCHCPEAIRTGIAGKHARATYPRLATRRD